MAKGYWIVSVDVSNPESYKLHLAENCNAFREPLTDVASNDSESTDNDRVTLHARLRESGPNALRFGWLTISGTQLTAYSCRNTFDRLFRYSRSQCAQGDSIP